LNSGGGEQRHRTASATYGSKIFKKDLLVLGELLRQRARTAAQKNKKRSVKGNTKKILSKCPGGGEPHVETGPGGPGRFGADRSQESKQREFNKKMQKNGEQPKTPSEESSCVTWNSNRGDVETSKGGGDTLVKPKGGPQTWGKRHPAQGDP